MSQSASSSQGAIRQLLKWIEDVSVESQGSTIIGSKETKTFIPWFLLHERLWESREPFARLNSILDEIFPRVHRSPLLARDIVQHYNRAICILIVIGRPHFITHFVRFQELRDTELPFIRRPTNFPRVPSEPDLYSRFVGAQWRFCAPALGMPFGLNVGAGPQASPDLILPLINCRHIGGHDRVSVYRVRVHEDHDRMVRNDHFQSHK